MAIIVPGPWEPKNLDPYLEPLLEDLRAYGPDGTVPATQPTGSWRAEVVHHVLLHVGNCLSCPQT